MINIVLSLFFHLAYAGYSPVAVTDLTVTHDLAGLELFPNQEVVLDIPNHIKNKPIDFASIAHRQSTSGEDNYLNDRNPGYTSLEILSNKAGDDWRSWGGSGSGPCNSKFAEIRKSHSPEVDNLYEWRKKGHISVPRCDTKAVSKDALFMQSARIRSLGSDSIKVHKVIFKVLPPKPTLVDEVIFSGGFLFGDFETADGRKYPGRASLGDYGHSLNLNRNLIPRHNQIPADWKIGKGIFIIPLKAGLKLSAFDIAGGDKWGPGEEDRGGAKVIVEIIDAKTDQVLERIMDGENVGTSGVLRASRAKINQVISADEALRVTIPTNSTMFILGARVSYY